MERYGSAMRMIQEEAVRSAAQGGVGRDVHSGLYCLSAKARLDGGSKGQTLAWAQDPAVMAVIRVELRVLAMRQEAGPAGLHGALVLELPVR